MLLIATALLSGACSNSDKSQAQSAESASTSVPDASSGPPQDKYVAIVGESAPPCPSGETVFGKVSKAPYSIADREYLSGATGNFSQNGMSLHPVFCAEVTEQTLIKAAHGALSASPDLCPAVKALPDGWKISTTGNSEPPEDLVQAAMKAFVAATGGGPTANASLEGNDYVAGTSPAATRPDARYDLVEQAIMSATRQYC